MTFADSCFAGRLSNFMMGEDPKYVASTIKDLKSVNMNGKTLVLKSSIPAFDFYLPAGTKNFEIPFDLKGPSGRYRAKVFSSHITKLDMAVLLPAGENTRLVRKLPNTSPSKLFIEIKSNNLTANNKGRKASFRLSNKLGSTVRGTCYLLYDPPPPPPPTTKDIQNKQNKANANLRKENEALRKRVWKVEARLNIMDGVIKAMENRMKNMDRRLKRVSP